VATGPDSPAAAPVTAARTSRHNGLDFKVAASLFALAVISFAVAWGFRPGASGPPNLPPPVDLDINFTGTSPPLTLNIDSYLVQTSNSQFVLKVNAAGTFQPKQKMITWLMSVQGLNGYICTPSPYQGSVQRIGSEDYLIQQTSPVPADNDTFLIVHLCWNGDPPLTVQDSYFSADLPEVLAPDQVGTLTRGLQLTGTSLSAYTLAESMEPTSISPEAWYWQSPLSTAPGSPAGAAMPVFGSSILGIQHDNNNTFISGIFFGIAGGALISAISFIPGIVQDRKAKQGASASSGKPPHSEGPADQEVVRPAPDTR